MKIVKPVLLGPKLIAVGPLKCFKGGGGNGSSGGGGGGGGSRGGGGKGGGGSTGEQSAQQKEAQLQTDAFRKKQKEEAAAKERKEQSMGGQLAGMDFSDIKRDPTTGIQTGQAKQRDDRGFLRQVGDFFQTGETNITKVGEEKERMKDKKVFRREGKMFSASELDEYDKATAGQGFFEKPSMTEYFGQKKKARSEGVKDFVFTDQAEVARLEAEDLAAAEQQKRLAEERKRLIEADSPDQEGIRQALADRAEKDRIRTETSGAQLTDLGRQRALQKAIEDRQDMREMGFDENIIDSSCHLKKNWLSKRI